MRETKLPKGWTYYELGQVLSYEHPTQYIVESTNYNNTYKTPVLTAGKTFIIGYTNEEFGIYDALPVIIFDDFTTSTQYVDFKFKVKSSAMKILIADKKKALTKFLYYMMQIIECKHDTHKRYWIQTYSKIKVLLPSIPEQQRIVTKIEELFSELDKGVKVLQKIKEQLKAYRQAVLKDAFEGRLTKKYRHSNKITREKVLRDYNDICICDAQFKDASGDETQFVLDIPKEWLFTRIGDIFNVEVGATPSRRIDEYWNGNINWVSSGEVKFNNIMYTNECITQLGLDSSSTKLQPIGSVLLAMIGEGKTRGQAAILMIPAAHNQNTAAILVSQTPCSPQYIYYYLKLNYEYTRRIGSGNNQKALNKERVRALNIPFTSFDEQTIIACEIEKQMSICDRIEQAVDEAMLKAERLRQSILKKAFEGKLVTQEETING